ncbi:SMC-Scp complex subunit ScpB [Reinekea blandensis]|uniref:Segregation and condensation protein B n=1 Tax=Reinekea blandensis MED297 TaxID=314283 RepID=A4BCE7_9GAMM|nr:SMC-Scp complex subunit ScpB [Reinekea blandensis]EAR10213.1 hypothetical protein MED297_13357 [Reinekea sp. MED297] [Reinekea blandensis MED297]
MSDPKSLFDRPDTADEKPSDEPSEPVNEIDEDTVPLDAHEDDESLSVEPDQAESPRDDESSAEAPELPEQTDTASVEDADPAAHDDVELGESLPDDELDDDDRDPYGGHEHEALKRILEAALFASGSTLSVNHLRDMFEPHERPKVKIVRQIMTELIALYEGRGLELVEVASGYRFQTEAETARWISRLWDEKPQRYSRALMETIALIAYRQPITRGEIEDVRGVAVSSNIIRTLLEREWVRVVGHRDVPGRPAMYATTRQFLDYFGLKSLDQLPSLSDIRDMEELNPQMPLEDGESPAQDDNQSEISFSGMIEKLRETEATGKTGNDYIDDQLDDELAAMDDVNKNFEQSLEQQRAEHEHPDLEFTDDDDSESETGASADATDESAEPETTEAVPNTDESADGEPEEDTTHLSEEEQWKIIQEKLAQQQALLDARESDPQGEDDDNE